MILVMDIGNTNIKMAVCKNGEIEASWRVSVSSYRTADEFGMIFSDLFATQGLTFSDIEGIIVSSVVPSLNYTIAHACKYYMGKDPIMVSTELKTGLTFKYANPHTLGADRIANAVGAYHIYGGPCIIVDLGTASTFGVIDGTGCFLGGAIAPGIKTSTDALANNASQLPLVELIEPEKVICDTTITNIQSGVVRGFRGLVKNIITGMKEELNDKSVKVIATGGLTELMIDNSNFVDIFDRALTLKGLEILYRMNK